MHVISMTKLRQFWDKDGNGDAEVALRNWHRIAEHATWGSVADVKRTYSTADPVERFIVFNIGGNKYRLIVLIDFAKQKLFVRHVLSHEEYSRGSWKKDPWFKGKKKATGKARPLRRRGSSYTGNRSKKRR
jgi:mRNA interferase HigB